MLASPIFFYAVSAHTKILMDRCQSLWVRKYWIDGVPFGERRGSRKGLFISAGATRGKKLFDGVLLSIRYFFDALDVEVWRTLLYRGLDLEGDVLSHPDYLEEAFGPRQELARAVLGQIKNQAERFRAQEAGKDDYARARTNSAPARRVEPPLAGAGLASARIGAPSHRIAQFRRSNRPGANGRIDSEAGRAAGAPTGNARFSGELVRLVAPYFQEVMPAPVRRFSGPGFSVISCNW